MARMQDLDLMNDVMVAELRRDMDTAAEQDIDQNERGSFAFHKLKMLDRVVDTLQKCVRSPFSRVWELTKMCAGLLSPNLWSTTVSSKS